ncbi:hypothetical protein [Rouxiella chamberiensis]|uniref:Uncharacterized protein n=1 Tax=Rouxiella chamberiensis TaxID=1513468 RepID=A0ABY7HUR4_9GAMM|nr:hypothetical protein [Rouxiella chamberiensis]WAT02784.1 hypothetical protein O1V66_09835 [Rouxiella chamberiensis]
MSSAVLPASRANASVTDWIAVFAGALGALMATLDISITNSALPQIQGKSAQPAPKAHGSLPAIYSRKS